MANETLYSAYVTYAAGINAGEYPVFQAEGFMSSLIPGYQPGEQSRSVTLTKGSTVVSTVVAEAVAAVPQALSSTSVTLTLQKAVVVTKPTREAQKYAGTEAQPERHFAAHMRAHDKKFDQDALALATGFSQSVDAGASMVASALESAAFAIRSNNIPTSRLAAVLSRKQVTQLRADIKANGGQWLANPNFNPSGLFESTRDAAMRGFMGIYEGIEIYESPFTATATGNNVGLMFAPDYALAALYPNGSAGGPPIEASVSKELGFLESVDFIKTIMDYQVGEYFDEAGVQLLSDV